MTPDGLRKLARRIQRAMVLKSHEVLDEARREEQHIHQVGMIGRAQGYERAGGEMANLVTQAAVAEEAEQELREKARAEKRPQGRRGKRGKKKRW